MSILHHPFRPTFAGRQAKMQCGIEVDIENQTDLIRARAIQERLMLGTQGGEKHGLDYAAESRQLHRIGGDCFDCLKLSEDRFCFIVGDASGKGTAAALMISSVQTSLRLALSFLGESPVAAMATANSYFHTVSLPDCYATVFCGVYDRSQRTLRYVNAQSVHSASAGQLDRMARYWRCARRDVP